MKAKKKIEAIAITAVMVVSIFAGLIPTAIGTITADSLTVSPTPHFYGQNVTVTWTSDSFYPSYIWINANTSWDGNMGYCGGNMANDLTSVPINQTTVEYTSVPAPNTYGFEYKFANWTVNESVQAWTVYVNDAGDSTFSSLNATATMVNAYNVTLQTGRSTADGNSTLAGDNVTVFINTTGIGGGVMRDGLPFNIALPEGENLMPYPHVNTAGSGNYSFIINTTEAGVGALRNITLSYGDPVNFTWNSTQLAENAGLWGGVVTPLQFNVSQVNLKAYDINGTKDVNQNITSVNITTLLGGGDVSVNLSYPINITLTCDLTNLWFNNTGVQTQELNLTIIAGGNEATQSYGNCAVPVNATLTSAVTSRTTGTITATVNTSGMTWTDTFVIHPTGEFNKLEAPATGTSYQVGKLVNITGWNATGVAPTLNITEVRTDATVIDSTVVTLNPIDNTFEYTWDTNETWNTQQAATWDGTYNKTGIYQIALGNGASTYIDSITITLNEDIAVAPNATSMPVNNSLWINGTTDRWNSNGTFINCTISTASNKGGTIINNKTLNTTITTFNSTTGLANYSILWDSSINLSEIEATSTVPWDTFSKAYYITVNDSAAKNTAATITITDSISVTAATGVGGYNFTARGTTARENGTIINVSLQTLTGIPIRYVDTTAHNGAWNASINASSGTAPSEVPLTSIEDYYIVANDSIVKARNTLTIGTGVLDFEVIPAEATMDDLVWINGTTDLANGTIINFNITNSADIMVSKNISSDDYPNTLTLNATVDANLNFNRSWQINASWITGNCTAPLTTLTVNASNGTVITLKTFTVNETLTITTPDFTIAPGGEFKVEGTLNRNNGTVLQIITETGVVQTNTTTATVYSGVWNTTLTAEHSLGNLPIGSYTITVRDAADPTTSKINASASITMTVATGTVTLVNPVDGTTYSVNESVPVSGTTNIGNGTIMTVMISRSSGPEGWTGFSNTTITCTSDAVGDWNGTWNMTADAIFQALATKIGDYHVHAYNESGATITHTITITEPTQLAITTTTTTVTVGEATDVTFTVTDAAEAAVSGATVTLSGVATGSDTTAADGTVTIAVTATEAGTITATASKTGYTSGTVEITATTPPVVVDHVVINEFIADRTSTYLANLIELYNPTDAEVNLTGWEISSPPSSVDVASLDGKTIAAGEYLVLEEAEDFSFALAGTGDTIVLKNGTTVVDQVAYGDYDDGDVADNAPAPGDDNSTGRDPNGVDTNVDIDDFSVFETPTIGTDNTPTLTLTVTASLANVTVNTSIDVTFTVTDAAETPVVGALVTLTGTPLAESLSNTTITGGLATIEVNATSEGTITVTASKTGYTEGTYEITASETVTGDVNGDGSVNVLDMIRIGQHFGETGTAGWIPEDVKADGVIDVLDMILIGQNWTG